jgi:alanine racemase
MRPVVRLTASILQVREVPAGTRVGYNGTWTARRDSRLATVGIGYADGWLRALSVTDARLASGSEGGMALCGEVPCPLAGRVSMDLAIFDLTDADPTQAVRGGRLTLIGPGLDIDEVARRAGTNGYEILTSLGRRHARGEIGA